MKVLFVADGRLSENTGFTNRVLDQMKYAALQGVEVHLLVVSSVTKTRKPLLPESHRQYISSVHCFHRLPHTALAKAGLVRFQARLLQALISRWICRTFDHEVVVQSCSLFPVAYLSKDVRHLVFDKHGDSTAELKLASSSIGMVKYANWLEVKAREMARRIVVVSPNQKAELVAAGISESRVHVVTCGLDAERFPLATQVQTQLRHNVPVVGYLGGLQPYQSPEIIASAFRSVSSCHQVHAVVATPERHIEVRNAFERQRLSVVVKALGRADVRQEVSTWDVGIIPRLESPVNAVAAPTKLFEYLASGVPVLIPNHVGGWVDLIDDRQIVQDLDASNPTISSFIESANMSRSDLRERCFNAARKFYWDHLILTLIHAYKEALEEDV